MLIRPATAKDSRTICAIWNPLIRDTTITYTNVEKTPDDVETMLAEKQVAGHPFFVACIGDKVMGFTTYGTFRSGPGYAKTMENTVILAPDAKGKGMGSQLMTTLEEHAKNAGIHSLIAGIDGANTPAILFHKAIGFEVVGDIKEAGFKFERWHRLVLMQKLL